MLYPERIHQRAEAYVCVPLHHPAEIVRLVAELRRYRLERQVLVAVRAYVRENALYKRAAAALREVRLREKTGENALQRRYEVQPDVLRKDRVVRHDLRMEFYKLVRVGKRQHFERMFRVIYFVNTELFQVVRDVLLRRVKYGRLRCPAAEQAEKTPARSRERRREP